MSGVALVLAGQGSHRAGMVPPWTTDPAGSGVLERAGRVLGRDLAAEWADGSAFADPVEAQLAVFVCGVAAARTLAARGIEPFVVAGHSLGEYAALVAAGALDLDGALAAVAVRARTMGEACRTTDGAMLAVLGPGAAAAAEEVVTAITGVLVVANANGPEQVVLSGSAAAIEAAGARLRAEGRRAVRLRVAGAFHSPLMAPAQPELAAALDRLSWSVPTAFVIPNLDGAPTRDPGRLRDALHRHLLAPVQWEATSHAIASLAPSLVLEAGASRVLTPLITQVWPDVPARLIASPADVSAESGGLLTTTGGPS